MSTFRLREKGGYRNTYTLVFLIGTHASESGKEIAKYEYEQ